MDETAVRRLSPPPTPSKKPWTIIHLFHVISVGYGGIFFIFLHSMIIITNSLYWVSQSVVNLAGGQQYRNTGRLGTPGPKYVSLQLFLSPSLRNVSYGCPPTVGSTSPCRRPLTVNLTMFFSQFPTVLKHTQTSLFCRDDYSQRSFAREEGEKKRRRCGGVQFLDALQIIKVSCCSPRHSLLPYCCSTLRHSLHL